MDFVKKKWKNRSSNESMSGNNDSGAKNINKEEYIGMVTGLIK